MRCDVSGRRRSPQSSLCLANRIEPNRSESIRSRFACRYLFVPNQALAAAIEQWTAKIAPLGAPVAVQIRTRMAGDEADEFRKAHLRQRRAVARDARALQSTFG
jgi:hypothetical protein